MVGIKWIVIREFIQSSFHTVGGSCCAVGDDILQKETPTKIYCCDPVIKKDRENNTLQQDINTQYT